MQMTTKKGIGLTPHFRVKRYFFIIEPGSRSNFAFVTPKAILVLWTDQAAVCGSRVADQGGVCGIPEVGEQPRQRCTQGAADHPHGGFS